MLETAALFSSELPGERHAWQQLLDRIASSATPVALAELTRAIDALDRTATMPVAERASMLFALDSAAQVHLRQAASLCLANDFGLRSVRYKAMGRDLHARLGRAYDVLVEAADAGGTVPVGDPVRADIYARRLRAASGELKWAAFDYRSPGAPLWERATRSYLRALDGGLGERPICLDERSGLATTVSAEFTRLVALHCMNFEQLPPESIEAAESLVPHLLAGLKLTTRPAGDSLFWLNLRNPGAPTRLAGGPEASDNVRYFRPADALPLLSALASNPAALPPGFGATPSAALRSAVNHVSRLWSPRPPTRRYRRYRISGQVSLAAGLGFVRTLISGSAALSPAAAWTLSDASKNGFGLQSGVMDPEICRVGGLVGIFVGDSQRWLLALIRRVRVGEDGQVELGVQKLSSSPLSVVLDDGERTCGALLCGPVTRGRHVYAIVEPGALRHGQVLFVRPRDQLFKLQVERPALRGAGFEIINCKVL